MTVKEIARCAVMTALLIAVQYALGFVSGVELVTAVFSAFCFVLGAKSGVLTAVAFSLLRCIIFGFVPNVILLYLVYYTLFAVVFALLGKCSISPFVNIILLAAMSVVSAYAAIKGLKVSIMYKHKVTVLLWVMCALFAALLVFSVLAMKKAVARQTVTVCTFAAVMTVMFTLLDDVLTPLLMGYSKEAATAYFYSSFLAMLPQTVCAAVSVFVLFIPLKRTFEAAKKI